MSDYLRIAVTFLDPRFHGQGDGGEPEWPPSPLRLLQAIVAANADDLATGENLQRALMWLERQEPPLIVAPRFELAAPYHLSVPNNAMDIVGRAWSRGESFGTGDANPARHRTMKAVRPVRMIGGDTVHYMWRIGPSTGIDNACTEALVGAANRIVALGWGVDLVVGHAERVSSAQLRALSGERWFPAAPTSAKALRTPIPGTLAALKSRHHTFLHRLGKTTPVDPLTRFYVRGYRRPGDPLARPYALFELRRDDDSFCLYPQRKLVHIAGMVRHLAKETMLKSSPDDVNEDWVESYVVGHRRDDADEHRQFSYLPLPSVGHRHADHAVRRVMVVAPLGDDAWLDHLACRLAGRRLEPAKGDEFRDQSAPTLIRVYGDRVARHYTQKSNRWTSVTPVILPGHDDRKPAKTRKLIDAALAQSGIAVPCPYEWSAQSRFPKALSAHKYHRDRQTGANRWRFESVKAYLQSKTWVHLTLTFEDRLEVPGPLVIGAGRHCGFGLMARFDG